MKKKINLQLTQYAIPDGEGFNALPIAFLSNLTQPLLAFGHPPLPSPKRRGKGRDGVRIGEVKK